MFTTPEAVDPILRFVRSTCVRSVGAARSRRSPGLWPGTSVRLAGSVRRRIRNGRSALGCATRSSRPAVARYRRCGSGSAARTQCLVLHSVNLWWSCGRRCAAARAGGFSRPGGSSRPGGRRQVSPVARTGSSGTASRGPARRGPHGRAPGQAPHGRRVPRNGRPRAVRPPGDGPGPGRAAGRYRRSR